MKVLKQITQWNITHILVFTLLVLTSSCTVKWTKAIRYGKVEQTNYHDSINITIENGLVFVPIQIGGQTYRFLLDSGAPFSVSKEIQNTYHFKTVSKGHIVDSDNNRQKVNYVKVDTTKIGNVPFTSQTAFVADFTSNPILACLQIDGIVGSNLMRQSIWTIDQEKERILLSNKLRLNSGEKSYKIPFRTDQQFNILVDVLIGDFQNKNLKVDYGSNGPISVPKNTFNTLLEKRIITKTYEEKGFKQSGIIGSPVPLNRQFALVDSVQLNELKIIDIGLKTGTSRLIGNKVLSRYKVTIDWKEHNLYLNPYPIKSNDHKVFGFRLGVHTNGNVYVQSVIENSDAYHKGVQPNMKVLKYDSLDFSTNSFCEYVSLDKKIDSVTLLLEDNFGIRTEYQIERENIISIRNNK